MKIAVCGKGGSGKSTVVALLAAGIRRRGREIFVLDSDESNASLFWMLGFDSSPHPLMDLVGGKKNVQQRMIARFSAGEGEPEMSIWQLEKLPSREIPPDYVMVKDGYRLVTTGKIHQALEGCACPMGTVTKEFLKKLELAPDEIALVDMEAGVEHFGRGVETSIDAVISVVEPSFESISLAARVMELTKAAGAEFKGAIGNKMASADQEASVVKKLDELGIPVVGSIGYHPEIQSACLEGRPLSYEMASSEIEGIVGSLLEGAGSPS
ncbi:MAG: P-loop NTPase [Desulfobacteraceae bacterium]